MVQLIQLWFKINAGTWQSSPFLWETHDMPIQHASFILTFFLALHSIAAGELNKSTDRELKTEGCFQHLNLVISKDFWLKEVNTFFVPPEFHVLRNLFGRSFSMVFPTNCRSSSLVLAAFQAACAALLVSMAFCLSFFSFSAAFLERLTPRGGAKGGRLTSSIVTNSLFKKGAKGWKMPTLNWDLSTSFWFFFTELSLCVHPVEEKSYPNDLFSVASSMALSLSSLFFSASDAWSLIAFNRFTGNIGVELSWILTKPWIPSEFKFAIWYPTFLRLNKYSLQDPAMSKVLLSSLFSVFSRNFNRPPIPSYRW